MNKDTIPVILPVPREVKAAWVRQSQAEGKKLTDWLLERINIGHKTLAHDRTSSQKLATAAKTQANPKNHDI